MLKGKKVNLRPILKSDIVDLNRWRNDYEVFKNLGGGYQPISLDQQTTWMDGMIDLKGPNKRFMITANDENVGVVGLYNINNLHRFCEFGIYIGEKKFQGQGIGKESTELLLNYAFNNLNLRKVKLFVNADNFAYKMYEKFGFRTVGYYEKERFIDGKYVNVYIMELFKENFLGVQ